MFFIWFKNNSYRASEKLLTAPPLSTTPSPSFLRRGSYYLKAIYSPPFREGPGEGLSPIGRGRGRVRREVFPPYLAALVLIRFPSLLQVYIHGPTLLVKVSPATPSTSPTDWAPKVWRRLPLAS